MESFSGNAPRPRIRPLTGVDLSLKMIDSASEKAIYDVPVDDNRVTFLGRCQTTFDLIISADVFIYVGGRPSSFRLAQQRLDPAGIFAFCTERPRWNPYRLKKNGATQATCLKANRVVSICGRIVKNDRSQEGRFYPLFVNKRPYFSSLLYNVRLLMPNKEAVR